MLTIKYRCWDTIGKVMLDWGTIMQSAFNDGRDGFTPLLYKLFLDMQTTKILLLYTGLKDKNGKEIYEGDILRNHNNPHSDEIILCRWQEPVTASSWTIEKPGFRFERVHRTGTTIWIADKHFEVIGNTYENPELLEEEPQAIESNE